MLIWSVTFWHHYSLDGLFLGLDGHFSEQGEKNGKLEGLYGLSGVKIWYQEIKNLDEDGHYGALDENNGGLDRLYLGKNWLLEKGVGGIGGSDEGSGCSDEGYGVVDRKYFLDGGELWNIFWAVRAFFKSLTLYFYAYHRTCFVSADD